MSGQSSGRLMASGFTGSQGSPSYGVNSSNPNQMNMTGWNKPAFGGMPLSSGFASHPFGMPSYMGGMAFNKSGLPPPPTGNLPPPPGYTPPVPGTPSPGGPGPGTPPGTPPPSTPPIDSYFGRPAGPRPFDIGNNAWTRSGMNVPQNAQGPMQQGQYGWGWQASGPAIPSMGAKEKLYIQKMMYGNGGGTPAAWANQVDNNNLISSIGRWCPRWLAARKYFVGKGPLLRNV